MNKGKIILAALFFSQLFSVAAFDVSSVNLHLYLSGLKEAKAPAIVEDHLVLSAQGPYRYVGAAFSYEAWASVHAFEINRYGIFVLAVPLPYGAASLVQYRLIFDGLWTADPKNPAFYRDPQTGSALSLASLPERPKTVAGVWEPGGEERANFYFEAAPGQRITVAGSFNGWDPFIHELEETKPGRYELELKLPPGEYYYVFFYRGESISDPLNRHLVYSKDGRSISLLNIKKAD